MPHGRLSLEAQLRGTTAAIESKKTPPQLLEALRRRKAELESELRERQAMRAKRQRRRRSSWRSWFPAGLTWMGRE